MFAVPHKKVAMPLAMTALLLAASAYLAPHPRQNVVVVRATDFALAAPETIRPGVTTFRLVNNGKLLHHMIVMRMPEGKTASDFIAEMKKDGHPPMWGTAMGGPNPAVPGSTIDASMDLAPGNYAMLCFIPSPGDPTPHVMKGMVHPFTVRGAVRHTPPQVPDVRMTLRDYSFNASVPLTAGSHLVSVTNEAEQPHEVVVVRVGHGHTIADVGKWVDTGMQGPPPGTPIGGMSPLSKGQSGTFPLRLSPGTYGLICFLDDAKDGKPHAAHGMVQQIEVAAK